MSSIAHFSARRGGRRGERLWLGAFLVLAAAAAGCGGVVGQNDGAADGAMSEGGTGAEDAAFADAVAMDAAPTDAAVMRDGARDAAAAEVPRVADGAPDRPAPDVAIDVSLPADTSADRVDAAVGDAAAERAPDLAVDVAPALSCRSGLSHPEHLGCTGLYTDWASRTIDPAVREFYPGHELWSDGAAKTRWIYLPPGQKIDVSNPNEWTFPIGTKAWKEFRLSVNGKVRKIETRFFWKKSLDEWARATYVWSEDESRAPEVVDGVTRVAGTDYEIPPQIACGKCHGGRLDNLLGFEAVSLASPLATGFTYADLQAGGWLSSKNGKHTIAAAALAVPGDAVEQRALGYLHTNCGVSCHNRNTSAVKFNARLEADSTDKVGGVAATSVFKLAINQISDYEPPGAAGGSYYRIRPLDITRSTFFYLMNRRDSAPDGREQMPPLATHKIDPDGVAAVEAWIKAMTLDKGYPAPGP